MAEQANILHADLDSFYASVEQRNDPRLLGRPVVVGGGVVLAASYEAKAFGVRTAMSGRMARRLCPDVVIVEPHFSSYIRASKDVFAIFEDTTPLVEGISIDEAFLDVSGLRRLLHPATPVDIAARLRARVRQEVGLAITVGVARTKFLAKVASAVGKPDGLLHVPPDAELRFLHPLPVQRLWGVGQITAAKLGSAGIRTVGDIAAMPESALVSLVGAGAGRHLYALANARDPRPVQTGVRRHSIGSQHALGRARLGPDDLDAVLLGLVDRVTRRMRAARRRGRTLIVRFRFADFSRATRSTTLAAPTDHTDTILAAGRRVLAEATPMIAARGLTMLGISVSQFDSADAIQLELPYGEFRAAPLDAALDRIKERFGGASVGRAVLLHQDRGIQLPMLPD